MIKQLQVIRAIAALAIVLIHVTSGQAAVNGTVFAVNQLMRFASPVFVLMAGMVLTHVETVRPSPSVGSFYRRRFLKVLVPYAIWSLFYFAYESRYWMYEGDLAGIWHRFTGVFPGQLLTGTAFIHLYFILIMVQLYALFPLLHRWLERHAASLVTAALALSAAMNGLIYLHQLQVLVLPSLPLPYVTLFPGWLFYFVLGMVAMRHEDKWRAVLVRRPAAVAIGLACWTGAFLLMQFDGKWSQTYGLVLKPSVMLYAAASFVVLYMAVYSARPRPWVNRLYAPLERIAAHSFLIYLLHPFCLNVIVRGSNWIGKQSVFYGVGGLMLLMVLTLAATWAGILVIRRLPFAVWLGAPRRHNGSRRQTGSRLDARVERG